MMPIISIGTFHFPFFGLLTGTGFLVGFFFLWRAARREGFNEEKVIDTLLMAGAISLIGARLFYSYLNLSVFSSDWGRVLLLLKYPGLSFFGALAAGVIALLFLSRYEKMESGRLLDIFAPALSIATAFGYGGCFLNGCFIGQPLTPLYLVIIYLILVFVLGFLRKKVKTNPGINKIFDRSGVLALTYLIVTGIINSLLAKTTRSGLYYLWLLFLLITVIALLTRFKNLAGFMIKFPQQLLKQIQNYLEERKTQTEKRLAELKKEDPFEDKNRLTDNAADDTEAHEKAGHERTQALATQLNAVLIQTRKALSKIKIGKYGVCENCGKMIDTDRLAAMPTATLCLACEKKREKK